jgi:hypothetical protein
MVLKTGLKCYAAQHQEGDQRNHWRSFHGG